MAISMKNMTLDKDGYLLNLHHWNPKIATQLAATESITLTNAHWEIIEALQAYYKLYEHAPSQRPFVKHIANTLGKEKGNSIYLMQLFKGSPAKTVARIAGLPRPTNCF
ncbi:MAG: TusE/DsrC/DsvC family sulfur relay protein [Candidatus Endonucleobacter sp. (ex Gigantidas childressi)]|nr:TusE/DsrC/DsvC family sulfur relay protein [Candidatus Endonucleobacter sp. (ex Gigantidas childressi)]